MGVWCGGTGRMSEAARKAREMLFDADRENDRLRAEVERLRKSDSANRVVLAGAVMAISDLAPCRCLTTELGLCETRDGRCTRCGGRVSG